MFRDSTAHTRRPGITVGYRKLPTELVNGRRSRLGLNVQSPNISDFPW